MSTTRFRPRTHSRQRSHRGGEGRTRQQTAMPKPLFVLSSEQSAAENSRLPTRDRGKAGGQCLRARRRPAGPDRLCPSPWERGADTVWVTRPLPARRLCGPALLRPRSPWGAGGEQRGRVSPGTCPCDMRAPHHTTCTPLRRHTCPSWQHAQVARRRHAGAPARQRPCHPGVEAGCRCGDAAMGQLARATR